MIRALFNWKTGLAIIAILIISGTIFYSQFIAKKIAIEERQKAEQWVEAVKLLVNDRSGLSDRLVGIIISQNQSIPIIQTNERGEIIDYVNLDSAKIAQDSNYVKDQLKEFQSENEPIIWEDPLDSTLKNVYYYGHSNLLNQVRYYPLVQLLIVGLFITITLVALTTSFTSSQNQVWAGMAKETAHQLGTPLSSLQGWVEMLKESNESTMIVQEMEKDIERLKLVSDRFGKIGSTPNIEDHNVVAQVSSMLEYIKKRAPLKVQFGLRSDSELIVARISPPLFDWVIENLLKNALDAMEGKGSIQVEIRELQKEVVIDVTDSGKGIPKLQFQKVFRPGFTTKKRGWGLGLSLSKRIVEQYHGGKLSVQQSEIGKGTTFRVVLQKNASGL